MSIFQREFPKTVELIEGARPQTFPVCAVGVAVKGQKFVYTADCSETSLFDLASLTKVLCTTTLYAIAEEKNKINIDSSVKSFFPKFPDSRVKLSHLLDHSSGLPAWLDLHSPFHEPHGRGAFQPLQTPKLARQKYENEIMLSWSPDHFEKTVTYSDLGFMLLGWALEKNLKSYLDALYLEWVAKPYKLKSLQFLPLTPNVVPTENCPWRGHVLRGEVHDDNCYVLGGVAGHAGLFGNVIDVLSAAELWLTAHKGITTFITPQTAVRYWTTNHISSSVRSLGWDGVSKEGSSTGHYFGQNSRGHLGYTGTSLWIDPDKDLIVTLLTNRVYNGRENNLIKTFRPLFHDTLLQELGFK